MSPPTSLVESAKRAAAYQAVADHLDPSYTLVGIGSGSTVVYVVEAIAALGPAVTGSMTFVPTGNQSQHLIRAAGLRLGSIDLRPEVKAAKTGSDGGDGSDAATSGVPQLQQLDVAFDGADEVDEDLNCIKGGGACHFQEKLVAMAAKKFICVADYRKLSDRLCTKWPTIPVEVSPLAAPDVARELVLLGCTGVPKVRQGGSSKAGPVVTDNGMWIIDAPFKQLLLPKDLEAGRKDGEDGVWEVSTLARKLESIFGVLAVGLFYGTTGYDVARAGAERGGQKPVAAYFGMADGSVEVRKVN